MQESASKFSLRHALGQYKCTIGGTRHFLEQVIKIHHLATTHDRIALFNWGRALGCPKLRHMSEKAASQRRACACKHVVDGQGPVRLSSRPIWIAKGFSN